jgi:hypothetical protein
LVTLRANFSLLVGTSWAECLFASGTEEATIEKRVFLYFLWYGSADVDDATVHLHRLDMSWDADLFEALPAFVATVGRHLSSGLLAGNGIREAAQQLSALHCFHLVCEGRT